MTHKSGVLSVFVFLQFFLAGCAPDYKLDDMKSITPKGSAFYRALHGEYVKLADIEASRPDMPDAYQYADRAVKSAQGGPQNPEAIGKRELPKGKVHLLQNARDRLTSALVAGGRKKAPRDSAHAQAMFDCWMEEQEENYQPKDIAKCRKAFEKSLSKVMAALEKKPEAKQMAKAEPMAKPAPKPAPPPRSFIVFFDWDKAKFRTDVQRIIEEAIGYAGRNQMLRVNLTGHADRTGSPRYNLALSQRRAKAVKVAFMKAGFMAGDISVVGRGESRPLVPTADGIREPRNRRVEIVLSQ
jgi:outer membrane protein OmpA-like peptidoglycan-associated protein